MSNKVIQKGSVNLNSVQAPGVIVMESLAPSALTGVVTNVIGGVGTATWGEVGAATLVTGINDYANKLGDFQLRDDNLGILVNTATMQGTNVAFMLVRVTDGTDTAGTTNINDAQATPAIGAVLTARYTGTTGNTLQAALTAGTKTGTYKLSIGRPGSIAETFNNLSGSGTAFWQGLVDAVNNGQSGSTGPSQLVVATLGNGIGATTVTNPGTGYSSATVSATGGGGTGFAASAVIGKALASIAVNNGGTAYTSATVTITGDGTGATAHVTIASGVITAITLDTPGANYTTATVAITGDGTGATATATLTSTGSVKLLNVTNRGIGYTSAPTLTISGSGSGATATASLGSSSLPATPANPYVFTGGTDGNSGVTATMLLGSSTAPTTGMYALQASQFPINLFALVGCDDPTTFANQLSFAATNACQVILQGAPGETISSAITTKNTAGIDSTSAIYLLGDWPSIVDSTNGNTVRMVTPQGFYAGLMGNLAPQESPLNKELFGILYTQRTYANKGYSDDENILATENGIDYISNPAPRGDVFAFQTGKAASTDVPNSDVQEQRMLNYLAVSLSKSGVLGKLIGSANTPELRLQAYNALKTFLINLVNQEVIQDELIVLNDSNNPLSQQAAGYLNATVKVTLYGIVRVFLIDLRVSGPATLQ